MKAEVDIAVIGGGAAGFFSAISAKTTNPSLRVAIYEKSEKLLAKVKISGGGRCNVTNYCFDHSLLLKAYPRGSELLSGLFSQFDVGSTIQWFENAGVKLKKEADNRMFPVTDNSQTIIDCLMRECNKRNIPVLCKNGVNKIEPIPEGFNIYSQMGLVQCKKIIIATGGSPKESGFSWLHDLGIKTVKPEPSLFTFNIPGDPIRQLAGLSVENAVVSLPEFNISQKGPLLITHWGLSGPAVIKLSAWAARELAQINYQALVKVDFMGNQKEKMTIESLKEFATQNPKKQVLSLSPFSSIPNRLWHFLVQPLTENPARNWAETGKKFYANVAQQLHQKSFEMKSKTTFKEEFVTCGGVALEEVNSDTLESKKIPGLYFAGEVLDVDGITGGFNFQAAWTTGFVAGRNASKVGK